MTTRTAPAGRALIERAQTEILSGSPGSQAALKFLTHQLKLSENTITHFGLGFDSSHTSSGRVLIPNTEISPDAYTLRAIASKARCAKCKKDVSAHTMSARQSKQRRYEKGRQWEHGAGPDAYQLEQLIPLDEYMQMRLEIDPAAGPDDACFSARCPFHDSSEFDLTVNRRTQRWCCVTCAVSGDVAGAIRVLEKPHGSNQAWATSGEGSVRAWAIEHAFSLPWNPDAVCDQVSLIGYLEKSGHIDVPLSYERGPLHVACPFHEDHTPSCQIDGNRFFCFACDASGTVIDAVINMELGYIEDIGQARRLAAAWLVANDYLVEPPQAPQQTDQTDWRSCPECGASANKARISWIVGQHPKYFVPKGQDRRDTLYHLPSVELLAETGHLLICEGYTEVWALYEAGYSTACAYNSARLSSLQIEHIKQLLEAASKLRGSAVKVTLVPSYDQTGRMQLGNHLIELANWPELMVARWAPANDHTGAQDAQGEVPSDVSRVLRYWGTPAARAAIDDAWTAAEYELHAHSQNNADVDETTQLIQLVKWEPAFTQVLADLLADPGRFAALSALGWMQHAPHLVGRLKAFVGLPFIEDLETEAGFLESGYVSLQELLEWVRTSTVGTGETALPIVVWGRKAGTGMTAQIRSHCKLHHRHMLTAVLKSDHDELPHINAGDVSCDGVVLLECTGRVDLRMQIDRVRGHIAKFGLDPRSWQIVMVAPIKDVDVAYTGHALHVTGSADSLESVAMPVANARSLELTARYIDPIRSCRSLLRDLVLSALIGNEAAKAFIKHMEAE